MRSISIIMLIAVILPAFVQGMIVNGDFDTDNQIRWRSDLGSRTDWVGEPTGWYSNLYHEGQINGNYGEPISGYGSGNCAALKCEGGNYYQQILSGVDAGTAGSYSVEYDGGIRVHSSYSNPADIITLRVSLWDATDDAELAYIEVDTPFSTSATSLEARSHILTYDPTGLTGHDLALRFSNMTVLGPGELANSSQVLFDNIAININGDHGVSLVKPGDRMPGIAIDSDPTLQWISGTSSDVNKHVIYFSTDESWVNTALPTDSSAIVLDVSVESYLHDAALDYSTVYYWRVDEVAGSLTNPAKVEKGPIWSFTTETAPCSGIGFDGDIDGDCFVDFNDMVLMAQDWMLEPVFTDVDINDDSKVDLVDFSYISRDWLEDVTPIQPSIMFISTHPDDEGIFFGGTMPYYAQVFDATMVHLSTTSGDWNLSYRSRRENELTNADTIYYGRSVTTSAGFVPEPTADLHFLRFRDVSNSYYPEVDQIWDWWNNGVYDDNADVEQGLQKVIDVLATYIRVFRPDVIATHDFDGEYGHSNHKATAIAVAEAYDHAADPGYVDGNLPWQAKKLYIHQSEGNGLGTSGFTFINWLFHDYCEEVSIDINGDNVADMTPREVANWGVDQHVSQGNRGVSTVYETDDDYDSHHSEWWGLYRSTVGPDTIAAPFTIMGKSYNNGSNDGWAIGNFFENI